MYTNDDISELFNSSIDVITKSKSLSDEIKTVIEKVHQCINTKNKIIIFGNGGSAADAQHMAAEFIGKFLKERNSIPAIALTTDTSVITSLGNDYGFESVFSRQCESLVEKNDIVIAISTSGKSKNVIEGMKISKKLGAIIVTLTGDNNEEMKEYSDYAIKVPSKLTPRIQEAHRTIIHIICELVERNL